MDRLRSPGGCPWDAAQTHGSLRRYLIEEAYEVLEAIDADDPVLLREELGDLLLQVLFHARIAEERVDGLAFDVDDVADDLVAKLTRRHPHVFGDISVSGPAQVGANWEDIKRAEKGRASVLDGVVMAQPALALAAQLLSRARRAGVTVAPGPSADPPSLDIGERLFALAAEAAEADIDPESALRGVLRRYADAIRRSESDPAGQSVPGDAPR